MNTDRELLRRYLDQNSETAFAEIVQRHLGLVYSTSLRRVGGDAQLAEDVAQKVFGDLARKAASLVDRTSLSGWLYVSAHVTSAAVVRSERRRKARETEAHFMETTVASPSDADWTRLQPVIDDALVALKADEREAIALRFFEQRSFAEVGAALHLTEDGARKRVDRAIDKLRALLARRGVTSTAAALALALTTISATSVPSGLAGKIAHHAFAQTGTAAGSSVLGTLASSLMPAAAVILAGGFLIGSQRGTNGALQSELARLTAMENTLPALRAEIRDLARSVADAQDLRRMQTELPELRRALGARPEKSTPATAALTVASNGTIAWGDEGVKLADFISRLRALKSADQSGESKIVIRAVGAEFSALAYVIDETRKAGIEHVVVESDATPNPRLGFSWF